MRSSSAWVVVAVLPELGVVLLPVRVLDRSTGFAESGPLKEKKLATLSNGTGVPNVTVIVPPVNAVVSSARNRRVLTPVVPEPLVTSASLV